MVVFQWRRPSPGVRDGRLNGALQRPRTRPRPVAEHTDGRGGKMRTSWLDALRFSSPTSRIYPPHTDSDHRA